MGAVPFYSLRSIENLVPGDHLCSLYETEEEHRVVLTRFIRQGLERGEKVLYILDAHSAEVVSGYLRETGLDPRFYLSTGQLNLVTVADAYMRDGAFDPDRMIELLRTETERALAEGYSALRATGEMGWAMRGLPGAQRLIEYEAKLNTFFPGSKCLALCQYARHRFDPTILVDVLATHPIAAVGTEVYDNFYYVPPADLLGMDSQRAVLSRQLNNLAARKRLEEELRVTRDDWEKQLEERTLEFKKANESLRALNEISLAVNSNLELKLVLDILLEQANRIPHSAAIIRLINKETGLLEPTACRNIDASGLRPLKPGQNLGGLVLETKSPLAILNVQTDPRTLNSKFFRRREIISALAVPLIAQDEALGTCLLLTKEEHRFGTEEIDLFSALANQAAIAIHNAQLYERVKKQAADLADANRELKTRTLQQSVVSLLGNLALARSDVSSLLDEAVVLAARTLQVEYSKVFELLPDGQSLLLRAGVGWKEGLIGHTTVGAGGDSQAGYTLRTREPVIVEDLRTETRFSVPAILHEHNVVSGMSVLLHGKERPYGVMDVHTTQRRSFSVDDINFLQSMANLLATAIERQEAEHALAEQKNLFKTIIDTDPECVKLLAADGTLLEMNQAGLAMIEADSADEVIGKCVYPLVVPDCREQFARINEAAFRGESGTLQFELVGRKGTHRWMETHAVPLRAQDGHIMAALSITRDISERRLTEEALRKSEERFQIVARATNDAIWDWNLLSNEVWWNEGVTTLFRFPADQVSAHVNWWYQNVHPEDRERIISGLHAVIETGQQTWRDEYRYRCGDGSYAFVIDRGYVIHEGGKPSRMIGCMTDISHRKQAQAELEGSHEQLRALAAHLQAAREEERTRVAREIHDELGQALTGVKMDLSWLRKKLPKEQDTLRDKIESMLALMDQTIQSVRRISTDLRPGVLDDLGLTAAIEWQIHEFQKRTGIKCQLAARLEDIRLDRPRSTALFRIFQETLTNITRHAHATKVSIKLEQNNGDVSLQVHDNGNGIPKGKLSDPRSLGLLGMRERALLLGGELVIQRTRGRGTKVTARIPVNSDD